jgi:uncharacterized membrane protein YebE (DUF533 family)
MNDLGIDVNQYKQDSAQRDSVSSRLFAGHGGKVAIVAPLLIVGAAVAFALGEPIIGAIAILVAAVAVGILAKEVHSEYKAQDPTNKSIVKAIGSVLSDIIPECLRSQKASI